MPNSISNRGFPVLMTPTTTTCVVIGEWSIQGGITNLSCVNDANPANPCGNNLGKTYGVPQIRRLHNGDWAAIFGNGFSSLTGDAGIFVMTVDSGTGAPSFYYFSTNPSGSGGLAFSGTGSQTGSVVTISAVSAGTIQVGSVLNGAR